tara:strand:- start:491 stop:871 length:381 start_codon:yes stop_codon:yes gene_type:complete
MQVSITCDAKVMHMPSTRVTVTLTKEQHDRLKVLAEAKAISLSEIIRECCNTYITSDAEVNQADSLSEIESKYISSLEDRVELLKDQIERKDDLISGLTDGQLVHKTNTGFRPLVWIRGLLSSSSG